MIDLKETNKRDPLKRNVEHGLDNMEGATPFDPPGAFDDEKKELIPADQMPEIIKQLMDEHILATEQLSKFETALVEFQTGGYVLNANINSAFSDFFKFYDSKLMAHNEKEDKVLFPLLEQKLLENGEHSTGENPTTAIDIMEDDHVRIIQLGTLTFNLIGIATRLRDDVSRIFVCETSYNTGRELIELLRLHIYREDYTLFPLAFKLISKEDFDAMTPKTKKYTSLL